MVSCRLAVIYAIALLCTATWSIGQADVKQINSSEKLIQLRLEIKQIQKALESAKVSKIQVVEQLRYTEVGIGKLNQLLQNLDRELRQQQHQLKVLKNQQTTLRNNLDTHIAAITTQITTSYRLGKQPYIKLLLNQKNPQKVARTLRYYEYYNRARLQQINQWQHDLKILRQTQSQIESKTVELQELHQERQREKKSLALLHLQRAQTLISLNKQITSKNQKLTKLIKNEHALAELVKNITQTVVGPTDKQPFEQLTGQLPWPIDGKLTASFGSPRNIGDLKWQGVFISASSGEQVRAISHGRIAYSDWLKGFGLLVILDHGSGYMSLYGQNESLYKEAGTWVEANEVIATVGSSGGKQKSGLYFEIRRNGKPTNPLKWLK